MLGRCLLAFVLFAAPAFAERVVVMRGTYNENARTNVYEYVGDENSLAAATLSGVDGVNGQDVAEANRAKLRAEVDLYQAAQRAAGVKDPKPLYVLIDAKGDWVYARWGSSFMLDRPGQPQQRVTGGFIDLGEHVDYRAQQNQADLAKESNRALMTLVNTAYADKYVTRDPRALVNQLFRDAPCARTLPIVDEAWPAYVARVRNVYAQMGCDLDRFDRTVAAFEAANPGKKESFEAVMNRRFRFSVDGQTDTTLSVYVDHLPHDQFVAQMKALLPADLAGVLDAPEAKDIEKQYERKAVVGGLNDALTHEIGHLVQFEAGPGLGYGPVSTGIAGRSSSHAATTLSNPGFALVEGWAEAAAFRYADGPTARDRQLATRIDYDDSVSALERALNDALLQRVGGELRKRGLVKDNSIPIEGSPMERATPADFEKALGAAAAKLGMAKADFDRLAGEVRADPSLDVTRRRYAYTQNLQSHAGEKKKRADFLSSEASVSYTVQELDSVLGGTFMQKALAVMHDRHPEGLAPLLEAYVARYPEDKPLVYATLAKVTDGILITPDQVSLVEADPKLEVDLDRDGRTPGPSANAAHPEAFPAESPTFGPVPELDGRPLPLTYDDGTHPLAGSPRTATAAALTAVPAADARPTWQPGAQPAEIAVTLDAGAGSRTIPPATVPDEGDLNRH